MRRLVWGLAATIALVLANACGSTVSRAEFAGGGELGATGGGHGELGASDDDPLSSGGEADASTGGTNRLGGSTADVAASGTSGGDEDLSSRPGGRGITDSEIFLGFPWAERNDMQGLANSVSGGSAEREYDNPRAQAQAVIDYVNENGGIAGRRVNPVWYQADLNIASPEGRAQNAQRACATFTEDHQVFAFTGINSFTEENVVECAIGTRTPFIDVISHAGQWVDEQRFTAATPYYYKPTGMLSERAERSVVNGLARQRFFTRDARVGLLVFDKPAIRRGVERGLKPALDELGVEIVDEIVYPDIINSPWPNFVLQFQSSRVTHVIFSSSPGASLFESLLFMRAAEAQQYRPRYGGAHSAAVGHPDAPEEQRRNAQGVMWNPSWLRQGLESYPPVSTNDETCRTIMRDNGFSDVPEASRGFEYCDFLFFLKQALEDADALTPEGLAASVARLGDRWHSAGLAFNGASLFTGSRTDGLLLVRDVSWSDGTNRHEYVGDPYPAPR